jgi:hypothetical protein
MLIAFGLILFGGRVLRSKLRVPAQSLTPFKPSILHEKNREKKNGNAGIEGVLHRLVRYLSYKLLRSQCN